MARKKISKSSKKPSSRSRKPAPRPAPAKKLPAKKPPARKTSGKPPSTSKPTPKEKPHSPRPPRVLRQGISLDRKLDILGVALALAGLLTLFSLLSPIKSSLTGGWASTLEMFFGLGSYVFPLALMLGGLWLVLRNFERIPQLALERLLGLVLLFANFLAVLHLAAMLTSGEDAFALARGGKGGGYLGALGMGGLEAGLGMGGAVIALLAWLLIALALSLDVTVLEMARWLSPLTARLQDWMSEALGGFHTQRTDARQGTAPGYPGFGPPISGDADGQAQPGSPTARPSLYPPLHILRPETQGAPAWVLPPVDQVLDQGGEVSYDDESDLARSRVIEETLASFGAPARVVEINRGPTITQFGVEPDYIESRGGRLRVRVSKITALADDLALALSARTIRIQAPVPGKGFVGIEVPNEEIALVALRDQIESETFKQLKSPLRFALGLNVSGHPVATDLSVMPHLLIAGATGSGKSVCVNALISCLLIHNTPDDLRLIMVDPKRVELTGYNGIPHLLAPVVVELERVIVALQWVTREMDMRYRKLAEAGCRNILEYNTRQQAGGGKKLPYLVVIIDELADLMMLAPDETERTVTRLAQLARATGIHLVIATQRPSVDVVTGLIKANFPARIAFAVASGVDSRVILDQPGAERLLGRGDMLFQAPDAPAPVRLQGVFVSESELQRLVNYWQRFAGLAQAGATAAGGIVDALPSGVPLKQMPMWEEIEAEQNADPLLNEAIDLARRQGRASISMLQRRLRIGYTRAARLIETMEEKGIVGPPDPGSGTREILDYGPAAPPVDEL
ncbi:MAG: DNA translocase FtsK 4TM domain-containing protein [Anaerolineales bacterium]|nr:DNA translocase FtsK 4TM domain-containing protein [Anaerolineales bacterium]